MQGKQQELDWHAAPLQVPPSLAGGIAFTSPEAQVQRTAELMGAGALVVIIPPLPAMMRGHLAEHLEEHLEKELAVRGAPSPYLAAWSAMPDDADERLADQLFRAKTVGASGIALALGSIAAAACPALTPEDSATLRWLALATTHSPLVVLLDDADLFSEGYDAPVPLGRLLSASPLAPKVETVPPRVMMEPEDDHEDVVVANAEEANAEEADVEEAKAEEAKADEAIAAAAETVPDAAEPEPIPEVVAPAVETPVETVAVEAVIATVTRIEDLFEPTEPIAGVKAEPAKPIEEPKKAKKAKASTLGVPVATANDYWRSWALALGAVKGPLPLPAFERLFAESYVPLANAIACGLDEPRAVRAHDEFRQTFERMYTDAFATFGATNRRPRLVMDSYEIAAKQARLYNARAAHLLVIDSLRHDVGSAFRDALTMKTAGNATLTSETVLWSALPTTTIRQLECLARGIDALRAPSTEEPQDSLRGRAAEVVRKLRVGSRELYKLDIVPMMLAGLGDEPGAERIVESLDEIADQVADAVARHVETMPPRTLLFIIGDHGFTVDRRGNILHGGASPEEVLVPAYSFVVGELH
jgi:hypothetical protein